MKVLEYMTQTYYGCEVHSLEDLKTNRDFSNLICALRTKVDLTEGGSIGNACYKAALVLLNNIERPYWNEVPKWKLWADTKDESWDSYFSSTSGFTVGKGRQQAINELVKRWNKNEGLVCVHLFLRSHEVLLREYVREFSDEVKAELLNALMPLIEYAETGVNA